MSRSPMFSFRSLSLLIFVIIFPNLISGYKEARTEKRKMGSSFDYLMLTRIYPTAVCRADDDAVADSCIIPQLTPSWTIHGLWPNYANGSYPQFCPAFPPKFDSHLIAPIVEILSHHWPNLLTHHSVESLWQHEYDKHGTCSQSEEKLDTELKYFNATLILNSLFDVDAALRSAGIIPSFDTYHKDQIQNALNKYLGNGKHIQFNCLKDKKTGLSLLGDVRMCIGTDFQAMDCPKYHAVGRREYSGPPHQPLPSYHTCPDQITFLAPTNSLDSIDVNQPKPKIVNILYYLSPFLLIGTHLFTFRQTILATLLLMTVIICLCIFYMVVSPFYFDKCLPDDNSDEDEFVSEFDEAVLV